MVRIIGYAFDADIHCVECTEYRFPNVESDEEYRDSEGNNIHPLFDFEEKPYKYYCSDCHEELEEDW